MTEITAQPANASSEPSRLSRGAFWMLLIWPIFIGVLVAFVTFQYFKAQLVVELSGRPPIAVINLNEYVEHHRDANRGLIEARAAADQLRAAGFLVFDRNQVYQSPEQVQVHPK